VLPGLTVPATVGAGDPARAGLVGRKRHGGTLGAMSDWFAQLERATGTSIKMSGHSNLSLREDSISGGAQAAQAYQSDVYQGRGSGGVYTDTDLDIDATLFNAFHYKSHISNYLYGRPDDNKLQLDYKTKSVQLQAGNISAGFQENSLIGFSRYLTGVQMTNHWTPQLSTTLLVSKTAATPQTRTVQGANSSGPYYVFSGQIVPGSVEVRVDNRIMKQGTDYTLNTETGELNFLNGNVILSTSTIAVTYETLGVNQTQGSIYGFRSSYTPRGPLKFGITYLTELSQNGSATQTYTQQFVGNASPLSPYVLDYPIDQTQPIVVKVNGAPLQKGIDYTIDAQFPNEIRLAAGLPTTSTVLIQYVPLSSNANPGNRTVLGLDGSLALGKWGTATLETAMSGISLTGNSINGRAAQLKLDLTPLKKLHTHITIKDVGNAFAGIESAGFNRNEKSVDVTADYSPTSKVHLNVDWEKAKRPSYLTSSNTNQFTVNSAGNDTYNQYSAGVSYDFTKNGTLSLNRQSMSTQYIVGGQSSSLSDTLSTHYTLGKVGLEAGLTRNNSSTNSIYDLTGITTAGGTTTLTGGTTSQSYLVNSSTFSKHVGLTWSPNSWFHLRSNLSDNTIDTTGTTSASGKTDARNADLTSTFSLKHGVSVEVGYALSDTGNLGSTTSTTGTTSTGTTATGVTTGGTVTTRGLLWQLMPWRFPMRDTTTSSTTGATNSSFGLLEGGGSNYNLGSSGNYGGFLGGGSTYGVTTLTGRNGTSHLNLSWSPTKRFHADLQLLTSSSLGNYQYNSDRNDFTFGINYTPSEKVQFGSTFNVSRISYTGGLGGSNTSTIELHMDTRVMRKINVRLAYQLLNNQSALNISSLTGTTVATTGTTTDGSLTNTSANTSVLQMHLDYPISNRQSLFLDLTNSLTAGYLGGTERQLAFGMSFRILNPLAFQLGWQLNDRTSTDATLASSNYHTSSLLAQIGLQF
jgi:hypothetical protein